VACNNGHLARVRAKDARNHHQSAAISRARDAGARDGSGFGVVSPGCTGPKRRVGSGGVGDGSYLRVKSTTRLSRQFQWVL